MGTSKSFLQDAAIRHSVFVQRFAGSQLKEMLPFLERTRRVTVARLTQGDITTFSRKRLTALYREIDGLIGDIYTKMGKKMTKNMKEFGAYESDFSKRMFDKGTSAEFDLPSDVQLASAIFTKPIILADESLTIESSLRKFSKAKRAEMIDTIKQGVAAGRTSTEIVEDVNLVTQKIQKRHLGALVRTVTNHVSTAARSAVYRANSDITEEYRWVSTLDGNTTPTCQALDGKVFKEGKGPLPPQHWGCRSVTVPEIAKEDRITTDEPATRPSVADKKVKQVDSRTTYNSWLKKQSKGFQEDVLGESRAKLFRQGNLTLGSFVDKNFKPLTLEQLKKKEPLAFEKAGLVKE